MRGDGYKRQVLKLNLSAYYPFMRGLSTDTAFSPIYTVSCWIVPLGLRQQVKLAGLSPPPLYTLYTVGSLSAKCMSSIERYAMKKYKIETERFPKDPMNNKLSKSLWKKRIKNKTDLFINIYTYPIHTI
jgi:hypothetical protein